MRYAVAPASAGLLRQREYAVRCQTIAEDAEARADDSRADLAYRIAEAAWDAFYAQAEAENICIHCLVPQYAANGDAGCPCQAAMDRERDVEQIGE